MVWAPQRATAQGGHRRLQPRPPEDPDRSASHRLHGWQEAPPRRASARVSEEQPGPLTRAAPLSPGGALSRGLGFLGSPGETAPGKSSCTKRHESDSLRPQDCTHGQALECLLK